MEINDRNGLEYWLSIDHGLSSSLFGLRNWSHLKMASEDNLIWIRGFTLDEIESVKVLSLLSATRYYLKEAKLYILGDRLPCRIEPSLLWTDIQRGMKLEMPKQNFNYFGLDQIHKISIVPSEKECAMDATMMSLDSLTTYIHTAPKIRLSHLKWTIINDKDALIIGTPLLPVKSEDYYSHGCFLIPGGWKLKYANMVNVYNASIPNSTDYWYFIAIDHNIRKILKSDFCTLSKGSVKQSINLINEMSDLF